MNRKTYALALLAALAALAIAGCGGGGSSTSSESSEATTASSGENESAKPVTAAPNAEKGTTFVSLANAGDLGMVLVDSKGMTLYEFKKDKGTESSCYGACAQAWPPLLTTGEPQPSNGTDAALLGTTKRKDGTTQVTYNGRPLYGFAGDKKPGEANGNDFSEFGAQWYALTSQGEEPEDSDSDSSSSDDSGTTSSSDDDSGGTTTSSADSSGTTTTTGSSGGGY